MASKRVLYMNPTSPPARSVMMMLDILGIGAELKVLNALKREQDTPELIMKNPMRTIPIFDDGEFSIADSHAIIVYLMENYGQQHLQLYPNDKKKRAIILQRMFFDCGVLFTRFRSVMGPIFAGRCPELTKGMIRSIEDAYNTLEMYLNKTQYIADNVMTVADISIVSSMSSLDGLHTVDGKRYPKLKAWLTKMNENDFCIKKNKPGSDQLVAELKTIMESTKSKAKSKI